MATPRQEVKHEEKKIIVILGITGAQGGSLANTYLHEPGWKIRGITRSLSSASATALSAQGIEMHVADLDKPESLVPVFRGTSAIFGLTDFWQPFFEVYDSLKHKNRAAGEYAYDVEVKRGKGMVDAVAEVLASKYGSRLERFIWSALPPVKENSKGKFTYVYHFDSKAEVTRYIREEKKDVWAKTSLFNIGFYSNNLIKMARVFKAIKEKDGSLTFQQPGSLTAKHPMIYPPADAGTLIKLLIDNPPGIDLLGVSELMSWAEFYALWSEITGIKAQVEQIPVTGRDELMPGGLGREPSESMSYSAEFGWKGAGEKDLALPWEVDEKIKEKLMSMRTYIAQEDWGVVIENARTRE